MLIKLFSSVPKGEYYYNLYIKGYHLFLVLTILFLNPFPPSVFFLFFSELYFIVLPLNLINIFLK